jgi:rhodanese-related sulfurtransferase
MDGQTHGHLSALPFGQGCALQAARITRSEKWGACFPLTIRLPPDTTMKHLQPQEAWDYLQQHPDALFVDVRMEIESLYVGRPPGVVNVPWYEYPDLTPDPQKFADAVAREANARDQPVLLICRSGQRTLAAGQALEAAGFSEVINVVHGFEGELDEQFQRSTLSGWRFEGLPWEQM